MLVPAAYAVVVIIWSTTPLAISWSGLTIDPVAAGGLRMTFAACVGSLWFLLRWRKLPLHRDALKSYAAGAVGVFGAMCCTYLSTPYVTSGLISLFFGITPMLAAIFSQLLLKEGGLTPIRWGACVLALAGLATIFSDDVALKEHAQIGLCLLLVAVTLFSLSSVLVKQCATKLEPFEQTLGSLLVSIPCFFIAWLIEGAPKVIIDPLSRSFISIIYLAVVGSLLGFVAYFFVLKRLSAATVGLVTLITPVFALVLGHQINNEPFSHSLFLGAGLIIMALAIFISGHNWHKLWRVRHN